MKRLAALALAAVLQAAPALAQAPPPPGSPPLTLEDLQAQARGSVADLQVAIAATLPAYREAALALIDTFFVITDLPLSEAADQLMVYLMLPEDRRDPRFALLGQGVQGWATIAQRAAEAGEPMPYWAARRFDRARLARVACILWGSGAQAYRVVAQRAGVPADFEERCRAFYADVARRWDGLLAHAVAPDTQIVPGRGVVSVEWDASLPDGPAIRALRESTHLEMLAEQLTADFRLRDDLTIRVLPCPEADMRWQRDERVIRVCSGLLEAFDHLIRPAYAAPRR